MRGHFGIGIYQPKTGENVGTLLRSAYSFGAAYCFTIGRRYRHQCTDTPKASLHMPIFHFQTFDNFFEAMPLYSRLVAVECPGKTPLSEFTHPQQAVYLLGSEDRGLPKDVLSLCHHTVEIDGARLCLNVSTAGSIVLWDRVAKLTA